VTNCSRINTPRTNWIAAWFEKLASSSSGNLLQTLNLEAEEQRKDTLEQHKLQLAIATVDIQKVLVQEAIKANILTPPRKTGPAKC